MNNDIFGCNHAYIILFLQHRSLPDSQNACGMNLMFSQALLSVYDKTNLLDLTKGLAGAGIQLLGSGGTAKKDKGSGYFNQVSNHSFH